MKLFVVAFVALVACGLAAGQELDDCLRQDSISCVQRSLYRKAKEFFGKDSIELASGVSLVKSKADDRASRSGKAMLYDQEIDAASDVSERQSTLENFVGEEVGDFLTGRSLKVSTFSFTEIYL